MRSIFRERELRAHQIKVRGRDSIVLTTNHTDVGNECFVISGAVNETLFVHYPIQSKRILIRQQEEHSLASIFINPKNQSVEIVVFGFATNKTAAVTSSVTNQTTRNRPAAISAVEGPISG